jgi:hypothetical protein
VSHICVGLVYLLVLSGCATAWKDGTPFYQTMQTSLMVESVPGGKVYVNDKYIGDAPARTFLNYEQEVKKKTRKVSYWKTKPEVAFAITLLSLGLYLPFSAIPVDIETLQEPTTMFRGNEFVLRVEAAGYTAWQETVQCTGENQIALRPVLSVLQ